MTKYPWVIPAVAAFVMTQAAGGAAETADPSTNSPQISTLSTTNAFVLHKTAGDDAAVAGRLSEALESYQKALDVRWDPFVSGRVGEIFLNLRDFALAAQYLQRAVTDPSPSLSDLNRDRFFRKLQTALREVCRVDFVVDPMEARVVIDGFERGEKQGQFWIYLNPGRHRIHAESQGFRPYDTEMTTVRGCRRTLIIVLHHAPVAQEESIVAQDVTTNPPLVIERREAVASTLPLYDAKLRPNLLNQAKFGNFALGLGLWIPFGMTPAFALGGQLHAGWRSRSWWDAGIEFRLAGNVHGWVESDKRALTWSIGAAPCARHPWGFFGCGLLQVDGGIVNGVANFWSAPGIGGRAGYEFHLYERVRLRLSLDVVVHFFERTHGSPNNDPHAANAANSAAFVLQCMLFKIL